MKNALNVFVTAQTVAYFSVQGSKIRNSSCCKGLKRTPGAQKPVSSHTNRRNSTKLYVKNHGGQLWLLITT